MINNNRPHDLHLRNIKFPVSAIASISHRISGVIIFLGSGVILLMLKLSLISEEYFHQIKSIMNIFFVKFLIWSFSTMLIYHFINGIRHILMDIGYLNTTLKIGEKSANIVFVLTGILSIIIAVIGIIC